MIVLLQAACFVLGVYLSIRMIAALYRILDLWYTIGTAYPQVMRGIVVCGALILGIIWLLGQPYRAAFVWGLVGYLLFYLVAGLLLMAVMRVGRRPRIL